MTRFRVASFSCCLLLVALPGLFAPAQAVQPGDYAVVVSKRTADDPEWSKVVKALQEKHRGEVITYGGDVNESVEPLRKLFPRYAAFVAQPEEASRDFVFKVHRLTRKLNDDPYTDVIWGVVTGYSAKDALRIASVKEPLVIRKGAGGTGINLGLFDEGIYYNEGSPNVHVEKKPGGKPETKTEPADAAKALVEMFNDFRPDIFVTSGHATDRDWQIGFPPNRRGQFRCRDGVLLGIDNSGRKFPVNSPNPKVYLPVGNCLMGLIRDKQSIALAWMGSCGVDQMIGYLVPTWYGRAGWGTQDYFFGDPGRYTLAESFYFNNQTIIYDLVTRFPKSAKVDFQKWNIETDPSIIGQMAFQLGYNNLSDQDKMNDNLGLLWDRDTLVLYGDPAWDARLMSRHGFPWSQKITVSGNTYTYQIDAADDCTPPRQPAMLLPHHVDSIHVVEGEKLSPLVTGNFIMLMNAGKFEKGKSYKVVFTANRLQRKGP